MEMNSNWFLRMLFQLDVEPNLIYTHQGKSRWHTCIGSYISPVLTYLLGTMCHVLCHHCLHVFQKVPSHWKWIGPCEAIKILHPWKMNMEPKNHPIERESHLPNLHSWVPCSDSRVSTFCLKILQASLNARWWFPKLWSTEGKCFFFTELPSCYSKNHSSLDSRDEWFLMENVAVFGERKKKHMLSTLRKHNHYMGVSKNRGTPIGWFTMENPKTLLKRMIWGYHYFRKPPYDNKLCNNVK